MAGQQSDLRARVRSEFTDIRGVSASSSRNITFQQTLLDNGAGPSKATFQHETRSIYDRQDGSESMKAGLSISSLSSNNELIPDLPTAADFFVPSLPGLPNMASHPT